MSHDQKLSRRELLRGRFLGGLVNSVDAQVTKRWEAIQEAIQSPVSAENSPPPAPPPRSFPVIRPPGAPDEPTFLARCTKCDRCAQACPHDAIIHAPARFRHAAGTPMIDPARSPCRMCDDFPCVTACPERALLPQLIGKIASARILDYNCLAHQGSFCTVCSEQCPEADAIVLSESRPTIDDARCTGCGICHHVCPAPTNAVAMMPLVARPAANAEFAP